MPGIYQPFNYFAQQNQPAQTSPTGQSGYNVTPSPYGYSGTFGGVPGVIGVPNPYQDLSGVYPNLSGTNAAASTALLSELEGQVSPETQALIQDKSAAFGVSSGMPLSGLSRNQFARNLGLTSEQLQQQGIAQYGSLIPSVSGTQTVNPALQAEIASRNATNLAAPIPAQAQSYAQSLFDKYLNSLRSPTGASGSVASPTTGTTPITGGTPSPAAPGGMSDEEFNAWQDYVLGGGAEPTYGTATTGSYTAGPNLSDYVNQPYDETDYFGG